MGVSLNGGFSHFTPQVLIIFSRKTPWSLGKPTILGNTHIPPKLGFFKAGQINDSEVPDGVGERFHRGNQQEESHCMVASWIPLTPKTTYGVCQTMSNPPKKIDSVVV